MAEENSTTEDAAAEAAAKAAVAEAAGKTSEQAKSLEDLLASLDDTARSAVLGEVHKARTEAANYRGKLRDAEPKAAEYDRLAAASKTEAERAQEALKAAETKAVASMQRVARAEVKAALTGLVDNPDSIIEDLNLSRFIDDDGEIKDDAIAALKTKYAGFAGKRGPRPDLSQGSGANGKTTANPAAEFASILQGQLGSR